MAAGLRCLQRRASKLQPSRPLSARCPPLILREAAWGGKRPACALRHSSRPPGRLRSLLITRRITEALSFLHYSGHVLHRNVCPSSILVTKKGTWKLGGLEFTGEYRSLVFCPDAASRRQVTGRLDFSTEDAARGGGRRHRSRARAAGVDPRYRSAALALASPAPPRHSAIFSKRAAPGPPCPGGLQAGPRRAKRPTLGSGRGRGRCSTLPLSASGTLHSRAGTLPPPPTAGTRTNRVNDMDGLESVPCQPWSSRLPKMAQPDLDYIAPEVQTTSSCSILSDMFSLGMVICSIFNQGRPLIQANHSASTYLKQLEVLEEQVHNVLPRVPVPLQEAVVRLLSRDTRQRPTAQLLSLIKYFSTDPSVHALQFLDVINMKDPTQKSHFYRNTLKDVLPYVPRKLWFQHVWPSLQQEMKTQEVLAAVLQPIIFLVQECTIEEYESIILPAFRSVFSIPKSIQATVTLLENLHVILEKTPRDDIRSEVLPMLYNAFESTTIQVQSAALVAVTNVSEYLDETAVRRMVLPKTKAVYEKNTADLKLVMNVLSCIEKTLDKLDKSQIIDEVLPLLWDVRLADPEITIRVVNIYRLMLSDKKYGLSVNLMATRVMPSLLPQTVNPSLNLDQFTNLLEVLQEMLDHIDRNQRNKLKLDNLTLPSPERHRPLRHQYSSDNMHVPPFNIPNLRIEQRKTSSAEDMARKNSADSGVLGGWWFGASPSSPDSNFLRVHNAFPNRRLSDNALMMPPKIRVAPSCASSPGGTPGGGLPVRRHSSIGPQERRGSAVNLSPPTGSGLHYSSVSREGSSLSVPSTYLARSMIGGSMPNTSSSVPFLLSSSMSSIRSRRPSACLSSSQGSGLLQQLGSGMYQLFSGRS
ncbi:protein kinase domain-containing protein ppk32 [Schistocerca americana]|uniref:protein kinase domain-containing protein ppk32 n=1 Tax=Schistocerca americana TaxID=7009 RepID=UPI001F500631|nr:protein kinase domain-containing protein ppk32 [Schistocerca americana]